LRASTYYIKAEITSEEQREEVGLEDKIDVVLCQRLDLWTTKTQLVKVLLDKQKLLHKIQNQLVMNGFVVVNGFVRDWID
jgi:hypothetical protein